MTNPVPNGRVSQKYQNKSERYKLGYHTGIDFAAPRGSDVLAACEGRVVYVGRRSPWGEAYGIAIIVLHRDMTRAIYAHLDKTLVAINEVVKEGQRIGKVGSTGNSTGAHLHFEVRKADYKYGDDVDPIPYIADDPDITPKATKEALKIKPRPVKKNAKPKPKN